VRTAEVLADSPVRRLVGRAGLAASTILCSFAVAAPPASACGPIFYITPEQAPVQSGCSPTVSIVASIVVALALIALLAVPLAVNLAMALPARPGPVSLRRPPPQPRLPDGKGSFPGGEPAKDPPSTRVLLMRELARDGVKHTPDDIVRIARAPNGRIVFLEQGTDKSGLRHIVNRHGDDFQNQGILESQIADYVMKAVIEGSLVGRQGSRLIYEFTYNDQTRWVAVTVSSNGYIVGANPRSMP